MSSSMLFNKQLLILAIITLLAVGLYHVLPEKRWIWIPDEKVVAHIYSDEMHGGASSSKWVDEDAIHFSCELAESPVHPTEPPFCGFHVHFDTPSRKSVDLSAYTRVVFNVDYVGGNEKLRFYITEFVPGFSDPVDAVQTGTGKYLSAYVDVSETNDDFIVQMDEYLVADWWVNNSNIPRRFSRASREQIMILGVDIAFPSAMGHHEFTLNKVEFYGPWITAEKWYLGIVLLWVSGLVISSFARIYYLRRYTSSLQEEKNKYQQLSNVDPLTDLLNRHGLAAFFEHEIAAGINKWPVCIVLIDIDNFKLVNDKYGHDTGDIILRRIADTFKAQTRDHDQVARWGGEEFLILLPETSLSGAYTIADNLRMAVADLSHPEISNQTISVSIGISEMLPDIEFKVAFRQADTALYRAKNKGRNCIVMHDFKSSSNKQ